MRALAFTALLNLCAFYVSARQLTPAWVEAGENGAAIVRVVVSGVGACPSAVFDGAKHAMAPRLPVPRAFMPVCEVAVPAAAKSGAINGRSVTLPKSDPVRIVVFGDTGCRIKGAEIQDCKNPSTWPFPRVAARAASGEPDLMIHVGDYLYREDMCPPAKRSFCGGTPNGDNWETWNADFFRPASKLLASVPWVFARGNHESCDRSWRGWFYYLDPHQWKNGDCQVAQPPYLVRLGTFDLAVFDSAAVTAEMPEELIERYASELRSIHTLHAWLVVHHPFWGFSTSADGARPVSLGLQTAWLTAEPKGIDLVVSGHVHLFELLSFDGGLPPALVAGHGGTNLARPAGDRLVGLQLGHAKVKVASSEHEFGYTVVSRSVDGWMVTLNSEQSRLLAHCFIQGSVTSCTNLHASTR